jgi:putative intracellular protease/amidase
VSGVAVLLTPGFADWECAYLLGVGVAFHGLRATTASPDGGAVVSQGGLRVHPDAAMRSVRPEAFDALVLVGGTSWASEHACDPGPLCRSFLAAGKVVAAICGGTLGLARAGLLNDRCHTSNASDFLAANAAPGYAGAAHYVDSPIAVRDGNVITASGTAPVSFTAEVMRAAGIDEHDVQQFVTMLADEFRALGAQAGERHSSPTHGEPDGRT